MHDDVQAVDKDRLLLPHRSEFIGALDESRVHGHRKQWGRVRRLLRGHPFVGAHQLDGHVGEKDVERCAVGGSAVLG